ncbi:GNAT family N-acetyltransferase [Chthonobacter rhizosphaerae]|uniref:GNAT family N-acetyltransferase n=1 Tax=Chthonobacter rhizosphaerae TaxID=2735553 RepID=UPI0015EE7411|nr:GNAT family N-acetyltransferase [Chthonobacter rhizosphaerae]
MHDLLVEAPALPARTTAVDILVAAFANDPAVRAIYPDEHEYRRHFPGFLTAFGGRAFEVGTADCDPERGAAALWYPPGLEPDGEAVVEHLAATVSPDRFHMLMAGFEIQAGLHPTEPHWYLPWIGVRPEATGCGIGGALLRRGLERADAADLPVYLEATSRRNAALYARNGFEIVGIVEAPGYPEILAMWRPARTAGRG